MAYRIPPDSEGMQPVMRAPEHAPQVASHYSPPHPEVVGQKLVLSSPSESDSDFHKIKVDATGWVGTSTTEVRAAAASQPPPQSRWRRHRGKIIAGVLAVVVIVVLAVAIPVTLVAQHHTRNAPQPSLDGAPSTSNISTSGAFNGSGLATIGGVDPSFIYYQRLDGALVEKAVSGSSFDGPILQDNTIRNGTPLAAETYIYQSSAIKHVVYVDSDNILRDRTSVNGSGRWDEGALGTAQFKVSTAPGVGLDMIAQYDEEDVSGTGAQRRIATIKVYYGGEDGLIHEVTHNFSDSSWSESFVFPDNMNGNAGITALQPLGQPMRYSYLLCADSNGVLSWFSMTTYPAEEGQWRQGGPTSINVLPSSSITMVLGANMAFFQAPSGIVSAVAFFPEHAQPFGAIAEVGPGVPRTYMVARYDDAHPTIWFQSEGDDVIKYQPFYGSWNSTMEDLGGA